MPRVVRVVTHRREVEKIKVHPKVRRRIKSLAEEVRDEAKHLARVAGLEDTGGGVDSIHVEEGSDGSYYVGPDAVHYYMGLHELGTEGRDPVPFMRPALDAVQSGSSFVQEYFSGDQ